ncbi:hypothetical protein GCM10010052_42160 [Paenarthrobacter histidinolovorans]|nr:hypothetical protein GCM10010052_42160 [Paenarthrobacter histidinolovorans]
MPEFRLFQIYLIGKIKEVRCVRFRHGGTEPLEILFQLFDLAFGLIQLDVVVTRKADATAIPTNAIAQPRRGVLIAKSRIWGTSQPINPMMVHNEAMAVIASPARSRMNLSMR